MRGNSTFQRLNGEFIAFQEIKKIGFLQADRMGSFAHVLGDIDGDGGQRPLSSPCKRSPGRIVKPQIDTVMFKSI